MDRPSNSRVPTSGWTGLVPEVEPRAIREQLSHSAGFGIIHLCPPSAPDLWSIAENPRIWRTQWLPGLGRDGGPGLAIGGETNGLTPRPREGTAN